VNVTHGAVSGFGANGDEGRVIASVEGGEEDPGGFVGLVEAFLGVLVGLGHRFLSKDVLPCSQSRPDQLLVGEGGGGHHDRGHGDVSHDSIDVLGI